MDNEQTTSPKKHSLGIILSLMTGYSIIYMDKSMISTAVIPIASEFNLDSAQKGFIMSIFFLGYSLMQIPGGWLADKIGAKKVLMLSMLLIAIFSFAFGSVSTLLLFIIIRFFAGIGHAGYPSSVTKAVSINFEPEKRTLIQSVILSTSGIGGILAFTLGANLINQNWRYAYVALGILFLVSLALIYVFVPKDTPKKTTLTKPAIPFSQVILNRNVIVLAIAMLLLNFLLYGNMSWLPSVLTQKFNLDLKSVGYLLAVNAVFQTLATMFAGVLLSKWFLGKEKLFIILSTGLSAALIIAFIFSNSLVLSMVFLILVSMVSVSAFTAMFTLPHKIIDQQIIGSSIGVINTGGTLGGFLAPTILGQLIKIGNESFTLSFIFMAIASILAGLTIILGIKKGEK